MVLSTGTAQTLAVNGDGNGNVADASGRSVVDADIDAITKKSPISRRDNIHPTMVHGHEYEGAGELLGVELHDHESFHRPAVIIDKATMRALEYPGNSGRMKPHLRALPLLPVRAGR